MTVESMPCVARRCIGAIVLAALFLMPIVGHGCHGDDVDHEPAIASREVRR
jgi:hypothetical protein